MFTERALSPPEQKSRRPELARLVRRIQALTLALRELRRHAEPQAELHAKERELEKLRGRRPRSRNRRPRQRRTIKATASTAGRLRPWLSVRHSLGLEAALVVTLYGVYELARGLVVGNAREADRHADQLVAVERSLHLFVEGNVQNAADALPGLVGLLGVAYLTLHLAVTAVVLLWLHQRHPAAFPFVRTTLLIASALALVGFLAYPTAPPRLAGIGIADTVSNGHINLNDGLVSSLYNPYAAVPSMHVGYALIVATSLLRYGGGRLVRVLGTLYPAFVLLVVVATGNHFFLDAAAGALVAALAFATASLLTRAAAANTPIALPVCDALAPSEELAA